MIGEKSLVNQSPSGDFYHEINQQVVWLENAVGKGLGELRILSTEVKHLEKELNEFLSDYYTRVGTLFEELRQINLVIKSLESSANIKNNFRTAANDTSTNIATSPDKTLPDKAVINNNSNDTTDDEEELIPNIEEIYEDKNFHNEVVENELKRIYRKLAKFCHPDMFPNDPYAKEIFAIISASYRNRDLGTLVKIEQTFLNKKKELAENPVEKLERLEKQYESLLKESDNMKIRKHSLINSPAYKLQKKVLWQKMCGEDIIRDTIERVTRQIAEKREYIYVRYGRILPEYVVREKRFALSNPR